MNHLSLKMKLGMGFGALLVVMLTLGVVSYTSVQKVNTLSAFVDQKGRATFYATSALSCINDQKAEYRAFLLTSQQAEMDRYEADGRKLEEDLNRLQATLSTDTGREAVAHLRQTVDTYHAIIERVANLHRAGRHQQAIALTISPQSESVRAELGKTVADLVDFENGLRVSAREQEAAAESHATSLILSLATLGVLVGVLVATFIIRSVTAGINGMVAMIEEIAANNLTVEDMNASSGDEIGKAGLALNRMKNNLCQVIQSIAVTAEHVAGASEELSSTATLQAEGAEGQRGQTAQVATAVQEMSATVSQISENSAKAAQASRQAADTARKGGGIVDETLARMRAIADSVSSTAEKIEELGKRSDQIGRIVSVIHHIADQTNMLALNAAIEAAHAGQQGRGFAVVADEVRKLAERTSSATKEIAQMIQTLQNETHAAVAAMEEGRKRVDEGVQTTAQAGNSLKEIIGTSENVGGLITQIATAAVEQASATEQINQNMESIAQLVKESAAGAQQSAKACQDLSELAVDLQRMVSSFKLDEGSGRSTRAWDKQQPQPKPKARAAVAR
jgi:methyl-accepting chemotaxis protein